MGRIQRASACLRLVVTFALVVFAAATLVRADAGQRVQQGWTMLPQHPAEVLNLPPDSRPQLGQAVSLDLQALRTTLAGAPLEGTPEARTRPIVLFLPTPGGSWQRFNVFESPLMDQVFRARHPDIRTYVGQGIDDPWATLRFEITPRGFSAQVLSPDGAWYIDPVSRGDQSSYTSFYKREYAKERPLFNCGVLNQEAPGVPRFRPRGSVGTILRNYRIAISCTGEFTQWAGGSNEALNLVVTAVSRLSGIYEQELAVRFLLVGSQIDVIYSDPATDPFSAPNNGGITLGENQSSLDAAIGSGAYDIGHVFHRVDPGNSNGIAALASVCTAVKAHGYSASDNPRSVFFVVDYVAHEVGHQFGGRHPHANCNGLPGDVVGLLVEPASGSTIMAYPGICGSTNLQPNADPYFNALNFDQMLPVILGSTCATPVNTGNGVPSVNAGALYNIPVNTPFTLTAVGSDPDGDALTFCWEQADAGPPINLPLNANDNGVSAIVRSRPPTTSPSRTVPHIPDLVANRFPLGETTPQVPRSMRWRVTIRDNAAGGAGVNSGETTLTVVDTGSPFRVTAPNAPGASFSGQVNVSWDVAGTTSAPINCNAVRILLSTDGGFTFPTILAASLPNSGSAQVALPNINTTTARIKVEAVGNVFFDISDNDFAIVPSGPIAVFTQGPAPTINDSFGNGNNNRAIDPGEGGIRLTIPITNIGTLNATNVVGQLFAISSSVSIPVAIRSYISINVGQTRSNDLPFEISVSPTHPCGEPILLALSVSSDQGSNVINLSLPVGSSTSGTPRTFRFPPNDTDPPLNVIIPDNSAIGVNVNALVADIGSVGDVDFRLEGTNCTTQPGSPTAGLAHTYVGDLFIRLFNPEGTGASIMNRPGVLGGDPTFGSSGNNFCGTFFDDDGQFPLIQAIAADGTGAPYTGTYRPAQPLAIFDGQAGDGIWVLNLQDRSAGDGGILRRFALVITPQNSICSPPLSVTGACCDESGACVVAAPGFCPDGSTYLGNSTVCSPNPCPQPTGACCATTGSCSISSAADCAAAGSTYQGDDSACSPNPCPQPSGACCSSFGNCFLNTQTGCSGTFLGSGTVCTPVNPCAQPSGECCDGVGVCTVVQQINCGGTWTAFGTCAPSPCAQPLGTCCLPASGQCFSARQSACVGDWTVGGSCTPNPCPQPTGACCDAGACTITTQGACAGIWDQSQTACTPNPCPQPTASCCIGPSCSVTTQATCTGTWGASDACFPNPCQIPQFTLTVGFVSGSGSGAISSTPAGIACPGTCSAQYTSGTNVAINPIPASNSRFAGWSGACSGTGPCVVSMTAARTVGARFVCRADLNGDGLFDVAEIFDFLNLWFAGDPAADMGVTPGVIDVPDVFEFLNLWFASCGP